MAIVEELEFKGNPIIKLSRTKEDKYPFQFGLSKAKLILESLDALRDFVARCEAKKAAGGKP